MQLLTKDETATHLKSSKRTIENWVAQGLMPAPIYIGRRPFWAIEILNDWIHQKIAVNNVSQISTTPAKRGRPRKTHTYQGALQ